MNNFKINSSSNQKLAQQHHQQQQQLQQSHHQQQQPQQAPPSQQYYDQYENYARPTAQATHSYNHNSINTINNNHANVLAYNNAHTGQGQGYSNNSHIGNNHHAYNADHAHNPNAMPIGKISDYDPITDGPRNMPNTSRPSSTLIYSSDHGLGKPTKRRKKIKKKTHKNREKTKKNKPNERIQAHSNQSTSNFVYIFIRCFIFVINRCDC